jgi:ABC-type dipeptide/oligopeptide/nickel transport system permease subunit
MHVTHAQLELDTLRPEPEALTLARASRPHAAVPPALWLGALLTGMLILAAALAPLIAPYPVDLINGAARLSPPNPAHRLGTDALGRDLFSRILYGARLALQGALIGTASAGALGIPLGALAGYWGGRIDRLLSRLVEVWLGMPPLLVATVLVARAGPSLTHAMLALGVASAPAFYRITRSRIMILRHQAYVEAAAALGAGPIHIMARHLLPNSLPSLLVVATTRMGRFVLMGGALSFVGLGAQPPQPEWGLLLADGRASLATAPWLSLYPGIAITLGVLGLTMLGEGLSAHLDIHIPRR